MAGEFDDIRRRLLEAIAEELADLAIVRLKRVDRRRWPRAAGRREAAHPARRAVEKAASILQEPDNTD